MKPDDVERIWRESSLQTELGPWERQVVYVQVSFRMALDIVQRVTVAMCKEKAVIGGHGYMSIDWSAVDAALEEK